MSKTKMFIPKNFTAEKGAEIIFKDCVVKTYDPTFPVSVNIVKSHFAGRNVLENMEIYIEEHPIEFIDKVEHFTGRYDQRFII